MCPSGWELDDDTGLCVDVTDSSDDSADEAASATDGDEADTLAEPLAATIADLVSGDPELSELAALLDADTIAALGGEGPFTLLAPSNEAIAALDPAERAVVLGDARRGGTLAYHLLPERLDAATIDELFARGSRSPEVITAQGEPVTITVDDGDIQINGASVSRSDLIAGNGVVHVIDQVLVPRETALNVVVALEPIQFASGSATIDPASEATLDRVAEQLLATDVAVTVEGHTDNQGDPALNQALSLDRARAVVNYLVAAGVDESRLGFEGFGETDPVATNDTDEGRALNRRIEFRIDN